MVHSVRQSGKRLSGAAGRMSLSGASFAAAAFIFEMVGLVTVGVASGICYHLAIYGHVGVFEDYSKVAGLTAITYCLAFLIRDEYAIDSILEGRRSNSRIFLTWSLAFVGLAVVGFLTKSTALFSRGWLVLYFLIGFVAALALAGAVHRGLALMIDRGLVRRRKLMIVGTSEDIAMMERDITDGSARVYVAARVVLPSDGSRKNDIETLLENAAGNARALGVEDIMLSYSLPGTDVIERCIAAFSLLPVSIHLGAGGLIARFKDARVARFGRTTALSLTREPLGPFEAATKRGLDIAISGFALVLLAPIIGGIALWIKLDSRGPIFFRQRRRGYNLEEFAIWKFRTMTTLDDGDRVEQAKVGDVRVTMCGAVLRRYSLDELPQLINVFLGHMSLVGPRPHAVAHDRFFEKRIALYSRRLNVKPGITGWAQVNGFRGATDTDQSMLQRVEHDLYYIDNWSVTFDLYILFLTVVSAKARSNAY